PHQLLPQVRRCGLQRSAQLRIVVHQVGDHAEVRTIPAEQVLHPGAVPAVPRRDAWRLPGERLQPWRPDQRRLRGHRRVRLRPHLDRKSTRLNSSHVSISYAVFSLKKKNTKISLIKIKIQTKII